MIRNVLPSQTMRVSKQRYPTMRVGTLHADTTKEGDKDAIEVEAKAESESVEAGVVVIIVVVV